MADSWKKYTGIGTYRLLQGMSKSTNVLFNDIARVAEKAGQYRAIKIAKKHHRSGKLENSWVRMGPSGKRAGGVATRGAAHKGSNTGAEHAILLEWSMTQKRTAEKGVRSFRDKHKLTGARYTRTVMRGGYQRKAIVQQMRRVIKAGIRKFSDRWVKEMIKKYDTTSIKGRRPVVRRRGRV